MIMKLTSALAAIALTATAAGAQPLPVPKPPGPAGSCPHGYTSSGSFCTSSRGRAGRYRETTERHVSMGLDIERLLRLAKRVARADADGSPSPKDAG
jgi:hypothetical protein